MQHRTRISLYTVGADDQHAGLTATLAQKSSRLEDYSHRRVGVHVKHRAEKFAPVDTLHLKGSPVLRLLPKRGEWL